MISGLERALAAILKTVLRATLLSYDIRLLWIETKATVASPYAAASGGAWTCRDQNGNRSSIALIGYRPDFYDPRTGLYHEHFALDTSGNAPMH